MGKLIDLTGKRFGSLVVISYDHKGESGESYWLCKCDCGSVTVKGGHSLRRGHTTTCGEKSHKRNEYIVDGNIAYCVLNNSTNKCIVDCEDIEKIKRLFVARRRGICESLYWRQRTFENAQNHNECAKRYVR